MYWQGSSTMTKKVQTDEYAKKKAVKLVVLHVKKKLEEAGEEAHELDLWFVEMEKLLIFSFA